MTLRRRITRLPMASAPLRRPLSPAEDIALAPVIAAARQAGTSCVVLILRSGAEITLTFAPKYDDLPSDAGEGANR
jgi:hypothetical protein